MQIGNVYGMSTIFVGYFKENPMDHTTIQAIKPSIHTLGGSCCCMSGSLKMR